MWQRQQWAVPLTTKGYLVVFKQCKQIFKCRSVHKRSHLCNLCSDLLQYVDIKHLSIMQWRVRVITKASWGYNTNFTLNITYSMSQTVRNAGVMTVMQSTNKTRQTEGLLFQRWSFLLTLPNGEVPRIRVTCWHRWVMTHLGNEEKRKKDEIRPLIKSFTTVDTVRPEVASWISQKQKGRER